MPELILAALGCLIAGIALFEPWLIGAGVAAAGAAFVWEIVEEWR